jgi:hypothetical protein
MTRMNNGSIIKRSIRALLPDNSTGGISTLDLREALGLVVDTVEEQIQILRQEVKQMNVVKLENFSVRNVSLEELVAVRSDLKTLANNYEDLKVDMPEWLPAKIEEVEREISSQTKTEKLARLKKLEARRASLMTADEKRKNVDDEIASLKAQINK